MAQNKSYKILFDNGGIPMWMSFPSEKEAEDFCKSGFRILKKSYPATLEEIQKLMSSS